MNFDQFRYVEAIVRYGSYNKAASALFVSQSSISSSIMNLESELNEKIFIRRRDGVTLTPFGTEFLNYVKDVLAITDMSPVFRTKNENNYSKVFSLCSGNRYEAYQAASAVYHRLKNNKVCLRIFDLRFTDAEEMVLSGETELAIYTLYNFEKNTESALQQRGLTFVKLADMFPTVSCGRLNSLYHRKESWVTVDMIQGMTVVLYTASPTLHNLSKNSLLQNLGFQLEKCSTILCNERAGRSDMMDMTDAISIGNSAEAVFQRGTREGRRRFRITGTDVRCDFGYIVKREHQLSEEALLFIEELKKILQQDTPEA